MTETAAAAGPTDRHLLAVYLDDHLAGSVAGADRMRRAAERLSGTPVGPDLARVAGEVAAEKDELREIIAALGLERPPLKQAAAWLGEKAARLKPDGRLRRGTAMTALIECEMLRSAVTGKKGLWQTLADLAPELGVDGRRMVELVEQSEQQVAVLDRVHVFVRTRALRTR